MKRSKPQPGDMVRVNSSCDAGGLVGRRALVTEVASLKVDLMRMEPVMCAWLLMDNGSKRLVRHNALDVISEDH